MTPEQSTEQQVRDFIGPQLPADAIHAEADTRGEIVSFCALLKKRQQKETARHFSTIISLVKHLD
ncbi:MAG TPA: hypothetical protein VHY35_12965 [Stellaceae bacterium]|jgi:hypothetical protein|nr:hypothetical protein [Stellaceae bacterium]